MADRKKRIEIVGTVEFPGVGGKRTISEVLEHVESRPGDHENFLNDRRTHAESYLRQHIASELKIEIVSVEEIDA